MRRSLRDAIKYLIESTQDAICPECKCNGPFRQIDSCNNDESFDVITCHKCQFEWQSAFRIILSPVVPERKISKYIQLITDILGRKETNAIYGYSLWEKCTKEEVEKIKQIPMPNPFSLNITEVYTYKKGIEQRYDVGLMDESID